MIKEQIFLLTDIKQRIDRVRKQAEQGEDAFWPSVSIPDGYGGVFDIYCFTYDNSAVYATFSVRPETSAYWQQLARAAHRQGKRVFLKIMSNDKGYRLSSYEVEVDPQKVVFSSFPQQINDGVDQ